MIADTYLRFVSSSARGGNIGSLWLPILFARPIGTSPLWRICSFIETKAARIFTVHLFASSRFIRGITLVSRTNRRNKSAKGTRNVSGFHVSGYFRFAMLPLRALEFSTRSNQIYFSIYIYIYFFLLVKIRPTQNSPLFSFSFYSFRKSSVVAFKINLLANRP